MKRQAGFTLIEMVVVIVIMAMITGLVLVRHPWHSAGLDAEVTARALTSALRLARSRAIAQDRDVTVITTSNAFAIDGGPPRVLPSGEALSAAQVVFTPDGGSSGGTILLAVPGSRIAVSVNWLTGRVMSQQLAER